MVGTAAVALVVVGAPSASAQDGSQDVFVFQRQIDGAGPAANMRFTRPVPGPQELGMIAVEPFDAGRPVTDAP